MFNLNQKLLFYVPNTFLWINFGSKRHIYLYMSKQARIENCYCEMIFDGRVSSAKWHQRALNEIQSFLKFVCNYFIAI